MAVVQLGRGAVPKPVPSTAIDVVGGAIINYIGSGVAGGVISGYALSGGSTHVGGFWPMQAGVAPITTDINGQAIITFPYVFANVVTAVTATVEGSDYAARIVSGSKTTSGFTVKILQVGINWTSGAAVTSVNDATITNVPYFAGAGSFSNDYAIVDTAAGNQAQLYAAATSGGVAGTGFTGLQSSSAKPEVTVAALGTSNSWSNGTVVTAVSGVSNPNSGFVVTVSGFLTAAANVSVNIDWIAAA